MPKDKTGVGRKGKGDSANQFFAEICGSDVKGVWVAFLPFGVRRPMSFVEINLKPYKLNNKYDDVWRNNLRI